MTPQDFAQSLGKGCVFLGAKLLLLAARAAPGRQVAPARVPKSSLSVFPSGSGISPSHLPPVGEHSHPGRIPAPAPAARLRLEDLALVTHRPQGAGEAPRPSCVLPNAIAPLTPEPGDPCRCAVVTKPVSALRPFGWVLEFAASPRKALAIPFHRRQTEARRAAPSGGSTAWPWPPRALSLPARDLRVASIPPPVPEPSIPPLLSLKKHLEVLLSKLAPELSSGGPEMAGPRGLSCGGGGRRGVVAGEAWRGDTSGCIPFSKL